MASEQTDRELTAIIVISIALYYPIGFYCAWAILFRALRLKCRRLVILIFGLISAGTLVYPLGRIIFTIAYNGNIEELFWLAAIVDSIAVAMIWLSLWFFAIKLWAIAQQLKEIRDRPFYRREVIVVMQWIGIAALVIAVVLWSIAQIFYKDHDLMTWATALMALVQIVFCCLFYDAYRQIKGVGGE